MVTDEEKRKAREKKHRRWETQEEEQNERRLHIMMMDESRAQILVEICVVDLEYAKARLKAMFAQETYWRAVATHPGEHNALFQKVLEEVQLMRKDLKDVVRGRTSEDSG